MRPYPQPRMAQERTNSTTIEKELQVVDLQLLAERTRFELVVGLLLRQFSKLVVSATHPPLQYVGSHFHD